jgi:hypothetical protein
MKSRALKTFYCGDLMAWNRKAKLQAGLPDPISRCRMECLGADHSRIGGIRLPNLSLRDISRRTNRVDRANKILGNRLMVNASWDLSMAQHMFSAFMWAIAGKVSRKELGHAIVDPRAFNVDDPRTWDSPALENAKLLEMTREIQSTGLGTLEQVYLSIIPPLSCERKLPSEAMVDLVRQKVYGHEANCRWGKASKAYIRLLDMCEENSAMCEKNSADRFVRRAVAAAIEFLLQATTEPLAEDPDEHDDSSKVMEELKSKLKALGVTTSFKAIYKRQSRSEQYNSLFRDEVVGDGDTEEDDRRKEENLFRDEVMGDENSTDALGWTKFYYEALGPRKGRVEYIVSSGLD